MHPVAITATIISGILIILIPRKYVFIPFIIASIFVPIQQRIVIAGLDLLMIRLLILFAFFRIFVRGEYRDFKLHIIDIIILVWGFIRIINHALLWNSSSALIFMAGSTYDAFGIYFFFRILIKDIEDITNITKIFSLLCIPIAILMLIEFNTGRNFFSVFGGVPEITMIRDGKLRCQGAFGHPILAGTYAATLVPLIITFIKDNIRKKIIYIICLISAILIVITSNSSGPIITLVSVIFGLLMWPMRWRVRFLFWMGMFFGVFLHIIMKAPIWFLVGRATVVVSSTGYHRAMLIDSFVYNFKEWWLFGTRSTAHWGHYGLNLWDVTNQFIRVAVDAGLISLILFITFIALSFKTIGLYVNINIENLHQSKFVWALGVMLLGHITAFMGVSYWDQIITLWYASIALISIIRAKISENDFEPIGIKI